MIAGGVIVKGIVTYVDMLNFYGYTWITVGYGMLLSTFYVMSVCYWVVKEISVEMVKMSSNLLN